MSIFDIRGGVIATVAIATMLGAGSYAVAEDAPTAGQEGNTVPVAQNPVPEVPAAGAPAPAAENPAPAPAPAPQDPAAPAPAAETPADPAAPAAPAADPNAAAPAEAAPAPAPADTAANPQDPAQAAPPPASPSPVWVRPDPLRTPPLSPARCPRSSGQTVP